MAAIINASTSGPGGIQMGGDASGNLQLQSAGNTIATISSSGLTLATALPVASGGTGLSVKGPAFAVYSNVSQSISAQTLTKIQFNLVTFDTNSNYDPTTNYRFTPTVAGYYQISAAVTPSNGNSTIVSLYKNGSIAYTGSTSGSNWSGAAGSISAVIYFNGSTDYVECYAGFQSSGSLYNLNGWSWFQGIMVRGA